MKNKRLISMIALVAFVMSSCIMPNLVYATSYGSEDTIVNRDKNVKEKIGEFSETIDGVTFTYDYKENFRTVTIQYPDGKIDKVTYDVEKKEAKFNDKLISFKGEVKDNMVDKFVIFTMGLTFVTMSTVVAYNAPNTETVNYYYYDAYNESHLLHNQYMYVNDEQVGNVFVYETW